MLIRMSWNSGVRNIDSDRMNSAIASQNFTQIQLGVLVFNIHESAKKNCLVFLMSENHLNQVVYLGFFF